MSAKWVCRKQKIATKKNFFWDLTWRIRSIRYLSLGGGLPFTIQHAIKKLIIHWESREKPGLPKKELMIEIESRERDRCAKKKVSPESLSLIIIRWASGGEQLRPPGDYPLSAAGAESHDALRVKSGGGSHPKRAVVNKGAEHLTATCQ